MTTPKRRSDAANALNDHYDDLASGVLAPQRDIDPEIAAIASQLYQAGRRSVAPLSLKHQLREDLMSISALPEPTGHAGPGVQSELSAGLRSTQPQRLTPPRRIPQQVLWTAAAALILLGMFAAFRPGSNNGGNPESAGMLAAISASPDAGTPLPVTGVPVPPEECTTHVLRLNEITAMLASVTNGELYNGGGQRPTGPEFLSLQSTTLALVFADDTTVDQTLVAEIKPVFDMYFACRSAGSIRQQFYLMTPSGIVRRLVNANGVPVWGALVTIGVPPTPIANPDAYARIPDISATLKLDDGRIAVRYGTWGEQYMVFRNIAGTWYIDEVQCTACG